MIDEKYSELLKLINCLENDLTLGEVLHLKTNSINIIRDIISTARVIQK